MKITTLNLRGFFDWSDREENIVNYLKEAQSDVIFFQEAVYLPSESNYSQPSLLNQKLRYGYEHVSIPRLQDSPHYPEYREGLAVISNHPIVKSEVLTLKKQPTDEHQRIVQFIDVFTKGRIEKFVNLHLSLSDEFSRPQLEELLGILKSRDEKRIITGDFNMEKLEAHEDLWKDTYRLATDKPYVSFPEDDKRIDYFLIPKEYVATNFEVSGDGLSDHRALSVVIDGK